MKWFKHDSDAGSDAKLRKLRMKYGAQGYGIYWYCLELIARNVDKNNLTFELEHDADLIADDFKLSAELVQEMMVYMSNLGLFENVNGIITCLKMASRTDEYTQKLLASSNTCKSVGTLSGESPRKSVLREENRREEIRTEKNIYTPPIPAELLSEWKRHRKSKPVTERVIKTIESEANKLGWSLLQAIECCCANSWQGFKAEWVNKPNKIDDRAGAVQAIFGRQIIEKDITNEITPF
jgi:hypothetical protein